MISGRGAAEDDASKNLEPGMQRLLRESVVDSVNSITKNDRFVIEEEEEEEVPDPVTGELFGPKGPEPTRYGDWERGGRCSDF